MQQLCAAIESYRASPRREQDLEPIAEAALALLQVRCARHCTPLLRLCAAAATAWTRRLRPPQHGLNGNRAVAPHVWAVVSACVRAFPIQLGASVDRAEALAAAAAAAGASAGGDLATPWLAQVCVARGRCRPLPCSSSSWQQRQQHLTRSRRRPFTARHQAAADGSLAVLLQRLRTQPQIATAYAHDAPVRDAGAVEQLVAQLQVLQVRSSLQGRPQPLALQRVVCMHRPGAACLATSRCTLRCNAGAGASDAVR